MDSHRSYAHDETDGPGRQPERGSSAPDWDRPGGDAGYASLPVDGSGGAGYGPSAGYAPPAPHHGFDPAYGDFSRAAEAQAGYPSPDGQAGYPPAGYRPAEPQSPYAALADAGGPRAADGATAVTRLAGVHSGEQPPPAFAPQSPPIPPGFMPGPAPAPQSPPASGTVHTAPTSGLPNLSGGRDEQTQVVRHPTEPLDRSALRRPPGGPGRVGDGVYRSRRPGTAAVIVLVTVLFEVITLRLLASAFLASKAQVGASIACSFLVIGLPMFGAGLYGLLSGAAAAPGAGVRAWLRAPLVYLPVGLLLFVCAGLAAG